jgi:hypothetical protein
MSREWEVSPIKEADTNDNWYVLFNLRQAEIAARRFDPNAFTEGDLRRSEARLFNGSDIKYLREVVRRKNSYRG